MNAACGSPGVDASMFDLERPLSEHARAARVCAGCMIRLECRLEAVSRKASGVFGGALYSAGKKLRELPMPAQVADFSRRSVVRAAEARAAQISGADTPERQKARRDALAAI